MKEARKYQSNAERQKAYRERRNRAMRNASALQGEKELIKVERPAVRYYGGKWRLGSWIIEQFPEHTCYVEPFCGGASVMLQKPPSKFEVMNDLNSDVIIFFDMLRTRTEELIRAIYLTPYAREELRRAHKAEPTTDPLERARRFYVRCWQSFGSGTGTAKSATGWRFQIGSDDNSRASAIGSWNDTAHLWAVAERLKQIQIENGDAYKVMERFDSEETVFYLDPPYLHETRYHNSPLKGYSHEMSNDDHRQMAEKVHALKGMTLISGYPSALYDELFAGWKCLIKETRDVNAKTQTECLWLSPALVQRQNQKKPAPPEQQRMNL